LKLSNFENQFVDRLYGVPGQGKPWGAKKEREDGKRDSVSEDREDEEVEKEG
jgi:hypothetical protein